MQIAPIGAAEIALANLSTGMTAQQAAAAATAAQPGAATTAVKEKQEVAKAKQVEKSEQAPSASQQLAQARSASQSSGEAASSTRTEPAGALTERQLFDYLAETEKTGNGRFSDPSELFGSALKSIDSTMQQIQDVMSKARPEATTASSAGDQSAMETVGAAGSGPAAEINENDPAKLLERSISVMWAAANLEVVVSSVTAVSSSAGTLVKQQ